MTIFKAVRGASVLLAAFLVAGGANAQGSDDSTIQGYEASSVHLTVDSSNKIVQVRVEGCELCSQQSYLPARDIRIRLGNRSLSLSDYQEVNGSAGTIMFDDRNDLVFEVYYWPQHGRGEVK
ncbi:MAG: hypothetical protein R3193_09070 [Marinobacter sp.]|nr:hypothetical protein [Marinobacter sp.]